MTDRLMGDEELVILVDEEGSEHEFYLIETMAVEDSRYAILLPAEEDEEDEGEVIILKIGIDEDGSEVYFEIEDDEEWEKVADAWEESITELGEESAAEIKPAVACAKESADEEKDCPCCDKSPKTRKP